MAVDTTWTDPSTGGAIDLDAGDTLTATVWDKVLSNLKHLGGVSGYHLSIPFSADWHIEGGVVDFGTVAASSNEWHAVSFTDAFSAAPAMVVNMQSFGDIGQPIIVADNTTTTGGDTIILNQAGTDMTNVYVGWIAIGAG